MMLFHGLLLTLCCIPVSPDATQAPLDDAYARKLTEINTAYGQLGESPKIAELVQLDGEIRTVLTSIDKVEENVVGPFYFREEYADLGLSKNFWSGTLEYDGVLLKRAHAIDPNSPYREQTLFSTIEIEYTRNGLPGVNTAHQYTLEFPEGRFIKDVYEILATFYDDLYKCLRGKVAPIKNDSSFSHVPCYEDFFTERPFESQMIQAQALSVLFYKKVLVLLEEDSEEADVIRTQRDDIQNGITNSFYWCSPC